MSNLLNLAAAQLGIDERDPRLLALHRAYSAAVEAGIFTFSNGDGPAAAALAKMLPDSVLVIETHAGEPDPLAAREPWPQSGERRTVDPLPEEVRGYNPVPRA